MGARATVAPQLTPEASGYLPRQGGLREGQKPIICSHNASNDAGIRRVRIPVAVLAFYLQIAGFSRFPGVARASMRASQPVSPGEAFAARELQFRWSTN